MLDKYGKTPSEYRDQGISAQAVKDSPELMREVLVDQINSQKAFIKKMEECESEIGLQNLSDFIHVPKRHLLIPSPATDTHHKVDGGAEFYLGEKEIMNQLRMAMIKPQAVLAWNDVELLNGWSPEPWRVPYVLLQNDAHFEKSFFFDNVGFIILTEHQIKGVCRAHHKWFDHEYSPAKKDKKDKK